MSLLEQGVETDNLAVLATLVEPFNEFETDDYFERVVNELSLTKPSAEDSMRGHVKTIAGEVLDKKLEPEKAIGVISRIYVNLDYPTDFGDVVTLEDEWVCEHLEGWSTEQRKNKIIELCEKLQTVLAFPVIENV